MMDVCKWLIVGLAMPGLDCLANPMVEQQDGVLAVSLDGKELFEYRFQPMDHPKGGAKFKGSNFIHPLRTPSGFCVTELQPKDHLHHFGLWWPWKYIMAGGRKINTWELQDGEGLVKARTAVPTEDGFEAESDYIDRTAPGGPRVVLKETAKVDVSPFNIAAANGFFLDIAIRHRCATEEPVEVVQYRYSGFSFRATSHWNKDNSTILTSGGQGRDGANFTRAEWVRIEGDVPGGGNAGVLLMGHPANPSHPQFLRTWDVQNDGSVFVNFNPVQAVSLMIEPDKEYVCRYRVYVYDGKLTENQVGDLGEEYKDGK